MCSLYLHINIQSSIFIFLYQTTVFLYSKHCKYFKSDLATLLVLYTYCAVSAACTEHTRTTHLASTYIPIPYQYINDQIHGTLS